VSVSATFWGCITYDGVGTLVPVDGRPTIDSKKYRAYKDPGCTFTASCCETFSRTTVYIPG